MVPGVEPSGPSRFWVRAMGAIQRIDKAWGGVLWLLMAVTAVYIGFIMVAIVYQTVFRTMGWDYTPYAFTFIEYGFVYCLFTGSPFLIRHRGHIYIELLTAAIPERPRIILSRAIVLVCALTCLIWVWYSGKLFLEHWDDALAFDELRAQLGMRSWIGSIPFPIGFLLMAIEFLRLAVTKETMHVGIAGVGSDRVELEETKRDLMEAR